MSEKKEEEGEMSFLEHLEALRWHLVRACIAILIGGLVCFFFKDFIFDKIIFAPAKSDFITYRYLCLVAQVIHIEGLCISPPAIDYFTTSLGESFMTHFQISIVLGLIIAFPYVFWEVWGFVSPGLESNERKNAIGIVFVCSFLFMLGILFGYYVFSPFAISFLAGYAIEGVRASTSLTSYVDYRMMFTLPTGLVFEMPIVVYFLAKIGIVGSQGLKKQRRMAFVIILIVSAIITPTTDMFSMLLIAIPLYLLYEVSIIVAHRVDKSRKI